MKIVGLFTLLVLNLHSYSQADSTTTGIVGSPFLVHFKSRKIFSLFNCLVFPAVGRSGAQA
jgi:hypothetical protein